MADRSLAVTAVTDRPKVALCAGKDCRKRCEFATIRATLAEQCDVVELKCVGICSGPVVVTNPASSKPKVYSKLRAKQHRRQLLRVVVDGKKPGAALAKRQVKAGKRSTALRKARLAAA